MATTIWVIWACAFALRFVTNRSAAERPLLAAISALETLLVGMALTVEYSDEIRPVFLVLGLGWLIATGIEDIRLDAMSPMPTKQSRAARGLLKILALAQFGTLLISWMFIDGAGLVSIALPFSVSGLRTSVTVLGVAVAGGLAGRLWLWRKAQSAARV